MKNFRNNLHSVFFDFEDDLSVRKQEYYTSNEYLDKQSLEKQVQGEADEISSEVQEQEFPNVAGEVASEVSYKYTDMEQLKRDRKRFQERVRSQDSSGKIYEEIWTKKITEGFGFLISSLKENGYFENKNESEEVAKIKDLYKKEVYDQYEKYIWRAGNKTFNKVKDNIFGEDFDYPVDKIYTQLTGATTISKKDRTHVEGYESEILDWTDVEDNNESMNDRENRNFLSNDLPEYLWNIRKTPWFVETFKWLPIVSAKEDRPSKVDRKAIKQFLKTSSRINVEGNKDKALALMEVFHDSSLNTSSGEENYKKALAKHGVNVDDKYIDDVIKAGTFYINTQNADNSVKDQHAIYLSILKIIESEGGVEKSVNKFKSIVEQSKKDKKTEKKEGYDSGEKLEGLNSELYDVAKKLGITDFTNATRLAEKRAEYFRSTPTEKVLANINNDRTIDAGDTVSGGSKTGAQFLEIFKQVGEEKALSNLFEHAKLINKSLKLGLDESKFTKEEIKRGNTKLILLLQDIISKPGEDLYTLLSGHSEDPFEGLDLKAEKEKADKVATEMVSKMDLEALNKDGLRLPTPESMQTGLSTALYTEYKRGVGLGGKISFDEWLKGVEMNTGFQIRGDGTVIIGIGLDYSKRINLGKGWSTTPELSAGAFIPLGKGRPELSGSVGLNDEVAKERITKKGIKEHLGVQGGVTLMPAGVVVVSAGINWSQDKLAGIESAEQEKMVEFRNNIISPILDRIYEERREIKTSDATKINFDDPKFVEGIRAVIMAKAIDEKVSENERKNVIDAVMRLLVNYNGADLAQEGVRDVIAQGIAEQYAMAWAEDRKAHIADKTYLSGASLGAFWVAGSPLVGLYGGLKFKTHDKDGYGDRWGKENEVEGGDISEWNDEELDRRINQQLGLSENKKLKIENGFIVIPASIAYRVNVNEKMRGLMKKDDNGNIFIDTQTPMSVDVRRGAATQSGELMIGGKKSSKYAKLDTLGDEWFTNEINKDKVLELGESITTYNIGVLNKALDELKKKFPEGDAIHAFDFSLLSIEEQQRLLDKLNALNKTKKTKIMMVTNDEGVVEVKDPVEGDEGRGLEIVYEAKVEMIDSQVRDVTESVYAEADKVTCNVLNLMCHHLKNQKDTRWPEYIQFAEAMNNRDYSTAKPLILGILRKLDVEINKQQKNNPVNFSEVANKIEAITDEISLGQALMSVNNIFARSIKVIGKGQEEIDGKQISKYGLTRPMGEIIAERAGNDQIRGTIEGSNIPDNYKGAYLALIDSSEKYRIANRDKFNVKESRAAQLENTVGFNLGNSINPENPLFNPEIYEQMVDLEDLENYGFGAEQKNALHERTMRLYAENSALINPILKALGLDGQEVKIENFEKNGEKGKLILDIGGKKVTLSAGMKFGYFTQCVNHTVILDDISAETQDGGSVTFNSGVWEGGKYREGNKSTILSTTEIGISGSVIVHDGREKNEGPKKPTNKTGSEPSNGETPDGTIPEQEGEPIEEERKGGDDTHKDDDNVRTEGEQRGGNSATNDEYDDF